MRGVELELAARAAIAWIDELGVHLVQNAGVKATTRVRIHAPEIHRAFDDLKRLFVWKNDGWCVGRAVLGAEHVNVSMLDGYGVKAGKAFVADTVEARGSPLYHVATSLVDADTGARMVLDPLVADGPVTLDDWALAIETAHWGAARGGVSVRVLPRNWAWTWIGNRPEGTRWFMNTFGAAVQDTWARAALNGVVDERLLQWHGDTCSVADALAAVARTDAVRTARSVRTDAVRQLLERSSREIAAAA